MRDSFGLFKAIRTLSKSPGFTLAVVVSLALGIGANSAIFSIVNGLLFHPAGVSDPETLVAPRITYKKLRFEKIAMSAPDFADIQKSHQIFSKVAMQDSRGFNYTGGTSPERLEGALVTWQWFDVFGAQPLFGRGFHSEEDHPGANHVVVLSFRTWQKLYGGDRAVLGRTIELNQTSYRVIGVMPAEYRWPATADMWIPIGLAPEAFAPKYRFDETYFVVARLAPDISYARAASVVAALTNRALAERPYARASQWSMVLEPFTEYTAGNLKTPLLILLTAVGLVLLIACSNIAGLLLIRATARSRELAIRIALGATRTNLLLQAVTESALLAVLGTALGFAGAFSILQALLALAHARLASDSVIRIDAHVLAFTVCAGLLSALLFGLVPAWHSSRADESYGTLKEGSRSGTEGRHRQRLRSTLVVVQIALACILLIGSGLLLRTLAHLQTVNTGFQSKHVMTAAVALPVPAYKNDDRQTAFWRSAVTSLSQAPGVTSAAAASAVPFSQGDPTASFDIEGRIVPPGDPGFNGSVRSVSPGYFKALEIRLIMGRDFNEDDRAGGQPVALIDTETARRYWPNQNAIGKRLRGGPNEPWATIVGIVGHVRQSSLAADTGRGAYYFCLYQQPDREMFLIARGAASNAQLSQAIRKAVHQTDPAQAVFDLKTIEQRIAVAMGPQQFTADILIGFAGVALVLAAAGLYGVISYGVARRTKEIGIRTALGAKRSRIVGMVVSQTMRLLLTGFVTGFIAVDLFMSLMTTQLFQVSSLDPQTLAVVAAILTTVSMLATAVPVWRAVQIDPVSALRNE